MKTALITGATSGIGLALAKCFARDHYRLVIAARSQEELDKTAAELKTISGQEVLALQCDLAQTDSAQTLYNEIKQHGWTMDALVNNAGFAEYGLCVDVALEKELKVLQLNVVSLTTLTKLFLDDMRTRNSGKILNLGSTASFMPGGPLMSVYYATKAYVLSLSQALSYELSGTGVTVTCLCPGPTRTAFQDKAGINDTIMIRSGTMSADDVARAGYNGLMRGKKIVVPGLMNKLQVFGVRFGPRWLVLWMVEQVQKKRGK